MKMTTVFGIATVALGAALAIGLGTHAQAAAPANYSRACTEVVASVAHPTASWRKRFMPVVRRAAPFAAPLAGTTTEPRRSWPPSAAGHKTSVECIKWLQARACSHPRKHPGSTSSVTPFGEHKAPG